ncbi:hypothetical protein [Caulobacter sp. S45]|uniref:hypothetical protein n=1 Tax=Caulobacter sp. S45 TaxID=1641861 RepID=UPI00131C8BFF|nr:hypothetical protein [Caulobacter sp. S45]
MTTATPEGDFNALIPEMKAWNDGAGISPEGWISCVGNYELAVGYSLIFWPRFVLIDGYVLRNGATEANLRAWEQATRGDRRAVEAVINHLHIADIHIGPREIDEAQLRYLGRILKQIHEVKLHLDFPDRTFQATFQDEPDLDLLDYELTFWQIRD